MRKTLAIVFILLLLFTFCLPIYASSTTPVITPNKDVINSITYFEDGSYLVISTAISTSSNYAKSGSYVKQSYKTAKYHSSDNELVWEYTLTGTFTVNPGVSAVCTNVTNSKNIYSNKWSFSDESTYASGNTAYGKGIFKKKLLLVTTEKVNIDMTITCDFNGNIS